MYAIDALVECSLLISEGKSVDATLQQIMTTAKSLLKAEAASIFLMDEHNDELYSNINSTDGELRVPARAGLVGHVMNTGEALMVVDAYADSRFNNSVDEKTGFRTRNILCAPLLGKGGSTVGVAQLINKVKPDSEDEDASYDHDFTKEDLELFRVFSSYAAASVNSSQIWEPAPTKAAESEEPAEALISTEGEVGRLLEEALQGWQPDMLALAEATSNRPLSTLALCMFDRLSLIDHFNLDRAKVQNFLIGIENGYDCSIAYHNRAHAASVLHFTYALLVHGGVADAVSYPDCDKQLILLASLLAAAIHDFEHEGLSNDFLVKTGADRALCYNDRSVNENHHVSAAFALMQHPDNNFLSQLSPVHYRRLRAIVVELVLGTDAAEGNKILKVFTDHLDAADKTKSTVPLQSPYMPTTVQETNSALQIMLKCADLGHLALEWDAHVAWVERLETEFFAQGDMEKTLEFPEISFLMDRDRPGVSKTQTGFFQFVVVPLFASLVRAFPAAKPMLAQVERNFESWRADEDARRSLNRRATM